MSVTIYVWKMGGGNVGHASMKVSGGAPPGDLYISWWPPDGGGKATDLISTDGHDVMTSYDQDKDNEGHDADGVVTFNDGDLDEGAFKTWWNGKISDKTQTYKLFSNNCSTAVAEGMKAGGAEKYQPLDLGDQLKDWWISNNSVWMPKDVLRYALWTKAKIEKYRSQMA
jgi:hypothetical protein